MGTRETAAGQGAVAGGVAGSQILPGYGTAIGAGIGGILGYVGASDEEKAAKEAHKKNEEYKRHQNKYAAFFGKQPTREQARAGKSPIPGLVSGLSNGGRLGGQIGNLYAKPDIEAADMRSPDMSANYVAPEFRYQQNPYVMRPQEY